MTNKQVADNFAKWTQKGSSLHMFIEEETVYSYGAHFPIARLLTDHVGKRALFTTKDYSNSTSKHKSLVRNALLDREWEILEIPDVLTLQSLTNIEYFKNTRQELTDKLSRARLEWTRQNYLSKISQLYDQEKLYYEIVKNA